MSNNPHKEFTDLLPLYLYAEMIMSAYEKIGQRVVVSIHVGSLENGAVTGASNMEPSAELDLLKWIINSRETSGVLYEHHSTEENGEAKEKLN